VPAHEALQLREHYREAARLPEVRDQPEEFRRWLAEAEAAAAELERALQDDRPRDGRTDVVEQAFPKSEAACLRCHAQYRDVPRQP
jgi:cytochrome c556